MYLQVIWENSIDSIQGGNLALSCGLDLGGLHVFLILPWTSQCTVCL